VLDVACRKTSRGLPGVARSGSGKPDGADLFRLVLMSRLAEPDARSAAVLLDELNTGRF
jgi:hypothetical protein